MQVWPRRGEPESSACAVDEQQRRYLPNPLLHRHQPDQFVVERFQHRLDAGLLELRGKVQLAVVGQPIRSLLACNLFGLLIAILRGGRGRVRQRR